MIVNWQVLATVAAPIVALFVGAALNRLLERRARLIAYFTHASAFQLAGANPMGVHTHGIVIRNVGRKPAIDVRVRHNLLPANHNVFPNIERSVVNLPGGGAEIVFPSLVPSEEVSIAYLYFPPVVYSQIHAGIRHSEGFAVEVRALPTPQHSPWIRRMSQILTVLGLVALAYGLITIGRLVVGPLARQ